MTEGVPLPPLHHGDVWREEFRLPLCLSADALAEACGGPRTGIAQVAAEEIGISGDTAIRLGRVFDTTPEFWMHFPQRYELERAALAMGALVDAIKPLKRAA